MIRLRELYRLQGIHNLRLIAGDAGLERTVTAAVLFEYDPSRMQLPDFYKGDLVVTTLAYARGEEALVSTSLLALMSQGIGGLLVKTAYFERLPAQVLTAANAYGTPIFLFDDTYIEEVILELTDLIRGRRRFAGFDKELDALMAAGTDRARVREILSRIDPVGAPGYRVYALMTRERMPGIDERLYAVLQQDEATAKRLICMEWKRMIVMICHIAGGEQTQEDGALLAEGLLMRMGAQRNMLCVGMSSSRTDRGDFHIALREAVYAARAAGLEGKGLMAAEDLGMYTYLFPMSENAYICEQCRRSLARIHEYDAQNKTNLYSTAQVYVENRMEIAAAAKALYQHPNTVRYRLQKIQKLMGMEDDAMFATMISLMVSLARILGEEGTH